MSKPETATDEMRKDASCIAAMLMHIYDAMHELELPGGAEHTHRALMSLKDRFELSDWELLNPELENRLKTQ